jgi:hypothetical protein
MEDDDRPQVTRKADGSSWLQIARGHPLGAAVSEVEVVPEQRRWMAASRFSSGRYAAKPMARNIGLLRALIILIRERLRPRDDVTERLHDIEALIIAGHHDAADNHIDRLRADHPGEEMKARVLGLVSLNLYDQGNEGKAQYIHEFALLCGTAHPAMVEIFGDHVPDRPER